MEYLYLWNEVRLGDEEVMRCEVFRFRSYSNSMEEWLEYSLLESISSTMMTSTPSPISLKLIFHDAFPWMFPSITNLNNNADINSSHLQQPISLIFKFHEVNTSMFPCRINFRHEDNYHSSSPIILHSLIIVCKDYNEVCRIENGRVKEIPLWESNPWPQGCPLVASQEWLMEMCLEKMGRVY